MNLKGLTFWGFGPFRGKHHLVVEDTVTVLTGANDAGKSWLLKAIQKAIAGGKLEEGEINLDIITAGHSGHWESHTGVGATLHGITTVDNEIKGRTSGERVEIDLLFKDPQRDGLVASVRIMKANREVRLQDNFRIKLRTNIILLEPALDIRDVIPLNDLNETESNLIKEIFGRNFTANGFLALDEINQHVQIESANAKLDNFMGRILPKTYPFKFSLRHIGDGRIAFLMADKVESRTRLSARGTGLRYLINICLQLMPLLDATSNHILLIDEPEQHLHADSQHKLRRFLELIAESARVQIIYTTHSPSMINVMRPESVRVIGRTQCDSLPTSSIENNAFEDNFSLVRGCVGLTPADSLLYAPCVIVTEGKTECLCLPRMLRQTLLHDGESVAMADSILSQISILDGGGDSFSVAIRAAVAQRAAVVVFLDGDKVKRASKYQRIFPDIPFVLLSDGKELEDLIPFSDYFRSAVKLAATSSECELEEEQLDADRYASWVNGHDYASNMATSKAVELFIRTELGFGAVAKHMVFHHALNDSDFSQVEMDSIRELLQYVRQTLYA